MAKKAPSNAGRPTKITEAAIQKLEYAFGIGCTVLEACCHADISKTAYYDYLQRNPKFTDRIELLKEKMPLKARKVIDTELDSGDAHTAKLLLERNKKAEFSTQQNVEQKSEVIVNDARDLESYPIEDLKLLEEIHKRNAKGGDGV